MRRMFGTDPGNTDYTSIVSDRHYARLEGLVADAAAKGAKVMQAAKARRSRLEIEAQISADHRDRRHARHDRHAGGDLRAAAAGHGLHGTPPSRSPTSTGTTGRWRCTGSARTTRRATRCCRAPSPAASPSTTACFTSRRSTSRWAASARPAPAPITANGAFDTLSKLKPVFYRSPFNRLADLYPPYGAKIARLEKMLRFMS